MGNCTTCKYYKYKNGHSHCDYQDMMYHKGDKDYKSCYESIDYDIQKIYEKYEQYVRGKYVY